MIMRRRAELDTINPPGSITDRGERTTTIALESKEQTLQHYLDRKYPETKKLTFKEWWETEFYPANSYQLDGLLWTPSDETKRAAEEAWKAAQENK